MFGIHVSRNSNSKSISKDILESVENAKSYNIELKAAAIFLGSPRAKHIGISIEEQEEIKKINIPIIAHSTYVAYIWNNNQQNINFIKEEIKTCINSNIRGLVIHLPKLPPEDIIKIIQKILSTPKEPILKSAIDSSSFINKRELFKSGEAYPIYLNHKNHKIKEVNDFVEDKQTHNMSIVNVNNDKQLPSNFMIYFETPALSPKETYYETPDKLSHLFELIRKNIDPHLKNFGLCIDTAHLWVNGVDIQSYDNANNWLKKLNSFNIILPPSNIIFHLNDSLRNLGCGPDAHASLCNGKIWGNYTHKIKQSGLYAFIEYIKNHNAIAIMERNDPKSLAQDYMVLSKCNI